MIEWYDFIFGSLAVVISTKFFPLIIHSFLAATATFAVALCVRPGALFFLVGLSGGLIQRK
jgi:hypothetical protein